MTRILVLPGIGDIYWVATILEDFCRQRGITDPEVFVWDFEGRKRSIEYVERLAFVRSGGYFERPPHPHRMPEFRASYVTGERSIVAGLFGFDYYIAVNGALRQGRTIAEATKCAVDWYPAMRRTEAEIEAEAWYRREFGEYVLLHFSAFGMFRDWVKAWPLEDCVEFIYGVAQRTGLPLLLTGCEWDRPFCEAIGRETPAFNLAGRTDADQFFGMLHGARAVAGWCGGNTILATTLKKPTLMLWSDFFPNSAFFRNACPPESWNQWYLSRTVERTSPREAIEDFVQLIGR